MRGWIAAPLALLLLAAPAAAQSDEVAAELERLRAENAVLRGELRRVKEVVDAVAARVEQPPPPPAVVAEVGPTAVVDIGALFVGYARKQRFEQGINADRLKFKQELERAHQRLRDMRKSPEVDLDRLRHEADELRAKEEQMTKLLQERVEAMTEQILAELEFGVALYARRAGLALVLKVDADDEPGADETPFRERIYRAQIGDVLFHTAALDRTQEVLAFLNGQELTAKLRAWEDSTSGALTFLPALTAILRRFEVDLLDVEVGDDLRLELALVGDDLRDVARLRETLRAHLVVNGRYRVLDSGSVRREPGPPVRLRFELHLGGWERAPAPDAPPR